MEIFQHYSSNTLAGSGNQSFFTPVDSNAIYTARIFYKVFCEGKFTYVFYFSNILDSTFSDGSHSRCNMICDSWTLHSLRVCTCVTCDPEQANDWIDVFFSGKPVKTVRDDEVFHSDPLCLDVKKGEFLCLELSFQGDMIPCHPESQISAYAFSHGNWIPSHDLPVPSMIGCDRAVSKRVGFFGDSITQGIGVSPNSYLHWNALLAEKIGKHNAYWNLGLGYGRAEDAASRGIWMEKAKQNDVVFICFGVNDVLQGFREDKIIQDLQIIKNTLKNSLLVFQTLPPFDYTEAQRPVWEQVNAYILNEIGKEYAVFDCVPVLCCDKPHLAKYGGHPNEAGCKLWAEQLYTFIKDKQIL